MSKQTKHRYLNSFFITTSLYLVASFFLFYIFADTLVVEEKKQEELKISLNHMMALQEPMPVEPIAEKIPLQEAKPQPVVEKKIDKPKKHEYKKYEHKKHIKEPIFEKIQEAKNEIIPNIKPIQTPTIDTPVHQINQEQLENIEASYLSKIRNQIEKNKIYPKTAKRLNQTGKVFITFLITKDGAIKNCRINKSSNFKSLDEASLEILMKIVSFEAIPKELNKDSWEITVPIVYQIS